MLARLQRAGLLVPLIMTVIGMGVLLALGNWQLARLAWKNDLIRQITERTKAPPVPLAEARKEIRDGRDVEYLRVTARGHFLHEKEIYFYYPDPNLGPGYHAYAPLETASDGIVFVNRGFVPEDRKSPETRPGGELKGEVEVTGLLRMGGKKPFFAPENDTGKNIWYWRDIPALYRTSFGAEAPVATGAILEAEAEPQNPGGWPKGGVTIIDLPNRHLEYALTWFGLAAALLAVFGVYAYGRLNSADAAD